MIQKSRRADTHIAYRPRARRSIDTVARPARRECATRPTFELPDEGYGRSGACAASAQPESSNDTFGYDLVSLCVMLFPQSQARSLTHGRGPALSKQGRARSVLLGVPRAAGHFGLRGGKTRWCVCRCSRNRANWRWRTVVDARTVARPSHIACPRRLRCCKCLGESAISRLLWSTHEQEHTCGGALPHCWPASLLAR
jgi:hypothetical protein